MALAVAGQPRTEAESENRQLVASWLGYLRDMNEKQCLYPYQVSPLPAALVQRVRAEMIDDAGHALSVRRDEGRHQCRACLRLTDPGEGFILLSYRPFFADQPYAETGPIFIHERPCRFDGDESAYPAEFPRHEVVLRAYNAANEIEAAERVGVRRVEDVISGLIGNPRVAYVHARNGTYGCYMFRIDKGSRVLPA